MLNKIERKIRKVFGNIKINYRVSEQGIPYLVVHSIVKRVLKNTGVPLGKKTNQNLKIPEVIINGSKELQKAFLQQLFDDEGWVEKTNYKIGLAQAVDCTKGINKKFLDKMEIDRQYSINKIPKEDVKNIKPSRLMMEIRKILFDTFLIKSNLRLKRIIKRKKGYVSAFWEINIGKKESLSNFKNKIGFYCLRKRKCLDLMFKSRRHIVSKDVLDKICNEAETLLKNKGFFKTKDISEKIYLHPYRIRKRLQTLVNRGIFLNKNGNYYLNKTFNKTFRLN